ncbi:hypothetical protein CPB83DRAFT_851910 [Crepidotus variabilis]|uniref:Uncharacterized protein n=1 Tax=Crepidotus variabilis TaxID=179855 RepID=A0A9P6JQR8_9AGAR|nr:hypothetical protein CPB83DRAFT_851910 [Crepidotus variabilis]
MNLNGFRQNGGLHEHSNNSKLTCCSTIKSQLLPEWMFGAWMVETEAGVGNRSAGPSSAVVRCAKKFLRSTCARGRNFRPHSNSRHLAFLINFVSSLIYHYQRFLLQPHGTHVHLPNSSTSCFKHTYTYAAQLSNRGQGTIGTPNFRVFNFKKRAIVSEKSMITKIFSDDRCLRIRDPTNIQRLPYGVLVYHYTFGRLGSVVPTASPLDGYLII